jgi:hypothetical protein
MIYLPVKTIVKIKITNKYLNFITDYIIFNWLFINMFKEIFSSLSQNVYKRKFSIITRIYINQ